MPAPKLAEENVTKVRRVIEEIYNQGNLGLADELFTSDFNRHDPSTPDVGRGPNGVRQVATRYRTAFPDLHLTIEDTLSDGDRVVVQWSSTGTHRGELQGVAPTGKKIAITGMSIIRFSSGRIAEEWVNWDTLGMLRQLAVIPQ
jgi:steroid delta-isomerase-like uncharacterized protein